MTRKNQIQKSEKRTIFSKVGVILCTLVVIVMAGVLITKNYFFPLKHFETIKTESVNYSIDPYLVLAIIRVESGFDEYATSKKDAKGLMQIMDTTAKEMNSKREEPVDISDIYNENVNITLGCQYLYSLIKKYEGNYYLAVCAYNAGMGNVDKWIEQGLISNKLDSYENVNIPFGETKRYLKKVISSYEMYKILY